MALLERVYRIERVFVAGATTAMGVLVFLDVVHRFITRERSWTANGMMTLAALVVVALALRTRNREAALPGVLLRAAAVVVALAVLRLGFVTLMPNGLVWSQTLGLVLMLWIAVVGASMATHEHRHLALDLGSKIWPKAWLPKVQALGNLVTAFFCATIGLLSVVSLRSHFGDWSDTDGAGGTFAALALPKWIAYAILPVGFLVMCVRFLVQAAASFHGAVEEDDAMHMLGLDKADDKADEKVDAGGSSAEVRT